jgi:hypothetical protein
MVLPLPLLVESLVVTLVVLAGLLLLLPVVEAAFFLFLPVRESTAVQAMKAAHITRPNCRFCMGMPVSAGERREQQAGMQQQITVSCCSIKKGIVASADRGALP